MVLRHLNNMKTQSTKLWVYKHYNAEKAAAGEFIISSVDMENFGYALVETVVVDVPVPQLNEGEQQ